MKLFKILFACFMLGYISGTFGYYQKVQDVFSDIGSDYPYLSQLQGLYDKGVIVPDQNGKFNPTKLLTRDEFVGIVMEVSCKDCIKPNTALDYILKYTGQEIFYDVSENNKFFYCIATGKENDVVKGYGNGYTCDDKTHQDGKNPFCTNNNITLEEALAMLLRNSSLFTINDNNNVMSQIQMGNITKNLSQDVKPKNLDGSVYTFYGYFQKALDVKYDEYDIYGKKKTYSLITLDSNGNLNPKKYISKEEFLKMSYIISKLNSCSQSTNVQTNNSIAGKIDIFPKDCSQTSRASCTQSNLDTNDGEYDYFGDIKTTCSSGIKSYTWTFYNQDTGNLIVKKTPYIDNLKFPNFGTRKVKLFVQDNCGNEVSLTNQVSYTNTNKISLSIQAQPIFGFGPLKVDFDAIVSHCPNCKYEWNFGDGNTSTLKSPSDIYAKVGTYDVELVVVDSDGNIATANVVIHVTQNEDMIHTLINKILGECNNLSSSDISNLENNIYTNISTLCPNAQGDLDQLSQLRTKTDYSDLIDTDQDGVYDNVDKCPAVKGDIKNQGCPILDTSCNASAPCKSGYVCNNGFCQVDTSSTADLKGSCIYPSNGSSVFGNIMCDTCPCSYQIDFLSTIRKCDIIFPAIVSPDKTEIYGRGEPYQVPYTK